MDETNAIVKPEQSPEQSLAPAGGLGFENWEVQPAGMELVQRTSRVEDAVPGKFRDVLTNEYYDSLRVIPLAIWNTRVLFPPGGDLNAEPLCRSNDGIQPVVDCLSPQAPECKLCPRGPRMWAKFKETKKAPDCQEKARMLFAERERGLPFIITFPRTSMKNVRNLKTAITRYAAAEAAAGRSTSLFDWPFEMKPVRVDGPKGIFYIVAFTNLKRVATIGEFRSLYEKFVIRYRSQERDIDAEQGIDNAIEAEVSGGIDDDIPF